MLPFVFERREHVAQEGRVVLAGRKLVTTDATFALSVEDQAEDDAQSTSGHADVADGHQVDTADAVSDSERENCAQSDESD